MSPTGSTCLVLFVYALSFPLLVVITALTLCPVFITHTNSIYGEIRRALLLMITTPAQKFFFCFLLSLRTSSLSLKFDIYDMLY